MGEYFLPRLVSMQGEVIGRLAYREDTSLAALWIVGLGVLPIYFGRLS